MKQPFLDRIREAPVVFDGAMGTMLYARGVFVNTCYDEVSLTRGDLVAAIHSDYVAAGAEVIETNTFGANRVKLRTYGLAEKTVEINQAAVRLARQAAGDSLYVAGSVGPCLRPGQLLRQDQTAELELACREQVTTLADAGVDLLLLETFSELEQARVAARIAGETGLPVFVSFAFTESGETAVGTTIASVVTALTEDDSVAGIGINCGMGPAPAYDAIEGAIALTNKPLIVMPNAGVPREVDGRLIYMSSPEYFTEYAKRFIELGVRGVGGCCGTTPEHIRVAARAIKTLSGVKRHVAVRSSVQQRPDVEPIPQERKSRFASLLARGRKVSSIELLPPRSSNLTSLLEKARLCHYHGVDAINIPDGPRASARISPMIAAIAIKQEVGIEPILHYCCRDRNLIGMQSDLLGGYAAGLRNFLVITGDPPKLGEYPDATGVFDVDAIGLTQVVTNLNHGVDIGGNPVDPPAGLFVGVGANPCAVDLSREVQRYRDKVEAGAEFAITQPVFDAEALFRFLDQARDAAGRCIPVIAGVWPLVSLKNAEFMRNEVPGVEIPDAVVERMSRCRTKEDGIRTGIELAQEICARIADRVAGFQVSAPFGKVDIALDVLGRV